MSTHNLFSWGNQKNSFLIASLINSYVCFLQKYKRMFFKIFSLFQIRGGIRKIFFFFSKKKYVRSTHEKCLNKALLMSTTTYVFM